MRQLVVMFAVCLAGVFCAESIEKTSVLPTQKAQGFACKSSDAHLGLMRGGEERVSYKPNYCGSATCGSNGYITHTTCGLALAGRGCKLVEHKTKPYPGCCPKVVC